MSQIPPAPSDAPPARPVKVVEDAVFDKRAMMIGLTIAVLLGMAAAAWRVATVVNIDKRPEPKEFEFGLAEPKVEEFRIRDPVRDIVREGAVEAVDLPAVPEERPNIHITRTPTEAYVATEVIQSPNTEFNPGVTEFRINTADLGNLAAPAKQDVGVDDAPEKIDFVTDVVSFPLQPIAAITDGPADMFKYTEPSPPDKPQIYTMATGPRPGRPLKNVIRAYGDQSAPSMGQLGPVNINLFGTSDIFRTFTRSGGVKAKSSVDSALHWLAVHQGSDGLWHAELYEGEKNATLAVTGLACLALMGGGHTTRKGEYSRNVLRGLEAIIRHQKPDGRITAGNDNNYTHAICTIALCEGYGRARDERMGAAAARAIGFCERAVNADGGWRYQPKADASDMSVTAWFIQALKTARLASIRVDQSIYSQALAFVDSVTDKGAGKESNGVVTYMFSRDQEYASNSHPALTAAGMMVRQFSGMGVRNHILVKGAELTKRLPPNWNNKDFYYWYYATYAMHNMGGEYRIWWNQKIRDVLLEHQSRDGDNAGSWDPKGDRWARGGGRVYCTALGALCLEVYYRYSEALNSFGTAPDLDELFLEQQP